MRQWQSEFRINPPSIPCRLCAATGYRFDARAAIYQPNERRGTLLARPDQQFCATKRHRRRPFFHSLTAMSRHSISAIPER